MKILVTKFRHIGDVLLSSPVFASLKAIFPDSQLHVSVNDFCIQVVAENPFVDKVIPYRRGDRKTQSLLQRIGSEVGFYWQFAGQYDLVINLTEGDRGCIISCLSGASKRMGYVKKANLMTRVSRFDTSFDSQAEFHTVQKDLQFIEALDPSKVIRKVSLPWTVNHQQRIDRLLIDKGIHDGFVLVHPVSRWMFKCWGVQKMAAALDYIRQSSGRQVLLTTSPDPMEARMAKEIVDICQFEPCSLGEATSLQEYSYLSSRASLFFGVDTAPMHIAAANDTPVVALFGASKPEVWGPWDNRLGSTYRRITGIQRNGIHSIVSNSNLELELIQGNMRSPGMDAIELDQVLALLDEVMKNPPDCRTEASPTDS